MHTFRRLLAIDPSLTCSGWALFSVDNGTVRAVGKIKSEKPSVPMSHRLEKLQTNISQLLGNLRLDSNDVLVCEAPTTMKDPHNAIKVEQVRGLFESLARERGVTVPGRINPRSVQYEIMGLRGKQLARVEVKSAALRTVELLYSQELQGLGLNDFQKHQDIVDALLVGRLALIHLEAARNGSLALEALFEVQKKQNRRSWRVKACAA
jgi:Holliday junction resolvasome RuvABC endonuclease subunit